MIAFLTGKVAAKTTAYAIVEVGGVGFKMAMSTSSLAALPAEGDDVTVHTYLHVREDELALFGFESDDERVLFEQLISVSGVGPKVALSVLSALAPDTLKRAIASEDVALLSSVPGIGKKSAQRLIIELKDRLDLPDLSPAGGGAFQGAPADATAEQLLRIALVALGGGR
jgi:Holliday junction DNA helicase RuvA